MKPPLFAGRGGDNINAIIKRGKHLGEQAAVTIGSLLGMVLVVLVFGAVITIIGGNINTAAANASLIALGVAGLLSLVVLILIVVVIAGLARHAD